MIFSKQNLPTGFYVYLYLNEKKTPYYCGKGSGKRAFRKGSPKNPDNIIIVAIHLTETEAFTLEKKLIEQYGRKDLGTGILQNRTDGGDGVCGLPRTKEHSLNISKALTGKKFSKTRKKNISKGTKGLTKSEEHKENLRKPKSEEHKANISKQRKGIVFTDEHRANISKARRNRKSKVTI